MSRYLSVRNRFPARVACWVATVSRCSARAARTGPDRRRRCYRPRVHRHRVAGATVTIRDSATVSYAPQLRRRVGRRSRRPMAATCSRTSPSSASTKFKRSSRALPPSSIRRCRIAGQRLTVDFTLYAATAEALVVTGPRRDARTRAIDRSADRRRYAGARVAARRPRFPRARRR